VGLRYADFEALEGQEFQLRLDEAEGIVLTLKEVTRMDRAPEDHESFSLIFAGPREPLLPQRMYKLTNPSLGDTLVFLVPVGIKDTGAQYEAVYSINIAT